MITYIAYFCFRRLVFVRVTSWWVQNGSQRALTTPSTPPAPTDLGPMSFREQGNGMARKPHLQPYPTLTTSPETLEHDIPDSNVHRANVGPTWSRQDQGGPHVGHANRAIWDVNVYSWQFTYKNNIDHLFFVLVTHIVALFLNVILDCYSRATLVSLVK